jgi:LytS/YehU family sensor histidine kinase
VLESIRLNCTQVHFTNASDGSVTTIAPLLLMPIIENSFKHTTDKAGAYITVDFTIAHKKIHFTLQNSIDTQRPAAGIGGIGLSNFSKRLDLYYPGNYTYQVNSSENQYAVSINIDCHE